MPADEHRHLLDALAFVDPSRCSYGEWLDVGLALHESGFSWQDWDSWSSRDIGRYHDGECERKWRGFGNGVGDHVKSGTIITMAERAGWVQPSATIGVGLGWDDDFEIGPDPAWVEPESVRGDGRPPSAMLEEYLRVLFDDSEFVGYTTESYESDGRRVPTKGHYSRTAGELRQALARTDDIADVVGDWDADTGAWIRFNPLDGKGVGNANVTEYRYALVESDSLDVDRQLPMIEAMNLPCAAIVSSAGKSVHAIVRIDAGNDYTLYRKRVERLYAYCRQHGFEPDAQNKNPSRLSRLPGATRRGVTQALLGTNVGAESWDAWESWVVESEDDLPDEVCGDWDRPIVLKPPLIGQGDDDCILRMGQKMIVVGDSKMGKSYTLIDLAEAISVGGDWLGLRCAKGRVFYVNLEIDTEEFRWRQQQVWQARPEFFFDGASDTVSANFVHWPLRGHAMDMAQLAPILIRRMLRHGPPGTFAAVVVDPIYKVNGGDDNDAKAVAKFTNMLDTIATACGCAVIYAHHHPKGAVGARKSIDRMSGSGVYGRDADTVLDFSPLYADAKARERWGGVPLFRASVDCRSFAHRRPIDAAFTWPRFYRDPDGSLARLKVVGEDPSAEGADRGKERRAEQTKESTQANIDAMRDALAKCDDDEVLATRRNVYERLVLPNGTLASADSGKVNKDGDAVPNLSFETFKLWTTGGAKKSLGPFSMDQTKGGKYIVRDSRTHQNVNEDTSS